jgi:hypothetical protein
MGHLLLAFLLAGWPGLAQNHPALPAGTRQTAPGRSTVVETARAQKPL